MCKYFIFRDKSIDNQNKTPKNSTSQSNYDYIDSIHCRTAHVELFIKGSVSPSSFSFNSQETKQKEEKEQA